LQGKIFHVKNPVEAKTSLKLKELHSISKPNMQNPGETAKLGITHRKAYTALHTALYCLALCAPWYTIMYYPNHTHSNLGHFTIDSAKLQLFHWFCLCHCSNSLKLLKAKCNCI